MAGVPVDWARWFAGTGARRVDLPTYPFQHQRYWPAGGLAPGGDVRFAGLDPARHPLLGAAVALADDGVVFTGRGSGLSHPWLGDHVVLGSGLAPGTALLVLAVRAADEAGCGVVEELTLATPLVLPGQGSVHVQVWAGPPG